MAAMFETFLAWLGVPMRPVSRSAKAAFLAGVRERARSGSAYERRFEF